MTADFDLVIAGGGPVGLATAIAARLGGLRPLVVEAQRGALPAKACGEGLMPAALQHLEALGVRLTSGRAFRGVRFIDEARQAEARLPGRPGLGLRRERLAEALLERARELGVALRSGVPVREHQALGNRVRVQLGDGSTAVARLLVGADGLRSPLRRRLGWEAPPRRNARFGVRCHYRVAPWTDLVEVHWHRFGEAYVTPVSDEEVGVALLSHGRPLPPAAALSWFPRLSQRLEGVACGACRGAGPLRQRARRVIGPGVALVGDAAGYVDAISGEGLSIGLGAARRLVARLLSDSLAAYPSDLRRLSRRYDALTVGMLSLSRSPRLRGAALAWLSRSPRSFEALLALAAGDEPRDVPRLEMKATHP